MRILFLSRWFPYPPSNGSKLRIFNLLSGLARQHEVDLISFVQEPEERLGTDPLQQVCSQVQVVPWCVSKPSPPQTYLGYFRSTPRYYVDTFSPAMQEQVQRMLAQNGYDLVIASQIDMAAYGGCLGAIPAIFEEAEAATVYEQYVNAPSLSQRLRYGLTWRKHRHYLRALMHHYAACTVVSAPEQVLLLSALGQQANVTVIPNGVDIAHCKVHHKMPQADTLIFTGSFSYAPNYEAMSWFVTNVLPLVRAVRPDVALTITGQHGGQHLPDAANVQLTGFVDDVRSLVAGAWISLAPLHTGGGTRLKILESMALGTPVVATSKGAEGLEVQPGKHLLVADTPVDFAQAVLQLLQSELMREKLVRNAYQLVCRKYAWDMIMPAFLKLVEKVAYRE